MKIEVFHGPSVSDASSDETYVFVCTYYVVLTGFRSLLDEFCCVWDAKNAFWSIFEVRPPPPVSNLEKV